MLALSETVSILDFAVDTVFKAYDPDKEFCGVLYGRCLRVKKHPGMEAKIQEAPTVEAVPNLTRKEAISLVASQGIEVTKGMKTKTMQKQLTDILKQNKWVKKSIDPSKGLDIKKPLLGLKATAKQLKRWKTAFIFNSKHEATITPEIKKIFKEGQHFYCQDSFCKKKQRAAV